MCVEWKWDKYKIRVNQTSEVTKVHQKAFLMQESTLKESRFYVTTVNHQIQRKVGFEKMKRDQYYLIEKEGKWKFIPDEDLAQ